MSVASFLHSNPLHSFYQTREENLVFSYCQNICYKRRKRMRAEKIDSSTVRGSFAAQFMLPLLQFPQRLYLKSPPMLCWRRCCHSFARQGPSPRLFNCRKSFIYSLWPSDRSFFRHHDTSTFPLAKTQA